MDLSQPNRSFEKNADVGLTYLAFGYFLFRLFYFAMYISHYVPPDEVTHFGLCQIFSKTFLLPDNSEETYSLGLVTHIPYLYYFLMGKCLKLNFFPVSDLIFLRFINCLLSFATVVYGYKWIRLVTPNRICHLLFVILITNTAMFSFLGAAVSYDNMTNFFAVTALYYLHLFFQNPNHSRFLLFVISVLGGALTKRTFLPLGLTYIGILIFHERKHLKNLLHIVKKFLTSLRLGQKFLLGMAFLLLVLNMTLYLENLIMFRKIVPGPCDLLTEEQAMKYRITAQGTIISLYKSGNLTYEEAVKKAKETIRHPGDRADTLYLLNLAKANSLNTIPIMNRVQYVWPWLKIMLQGTVGIQGHVFMGKKSCMFAIYKLVFLFSFFLFIRYWKPTDSGGLLTDALFLCLFYAIMLMQFVNYSFYTQTFSLENALLGRYFFPVIVPFYGVVVYYLVNPFKKPLQLAIFISISIFFIWGDFPYFLLNASSQWYIPNG